MKIHLSDDRRCLTEARVPNSNGEEGLPFETRNSCLSEAPSVTTFTRTCVQETRQWKGTRGLPYDHINNDLRLYGVQSFLNK